MNKKVSYMPPGYNNITPYLIAKNASKAIDFYKQVFDAKEVLRMEAPNNRIGHAELTIGDSKFMISDECPEVEALAPHTPGCSAVTLHLYVEDVDKVAEKAIAHGAKLLRKIEDQFYGDRCGTIVDPFGHKWHLSTHIEDVSEEETKRRAEKLFANE